MNEEENPLNEYSHFLNSYNDHLTYPILCLYATSDPHCSNKERAMIERHLKTCESCRQKLQEVQEMESQWGAEQQTGAAARPAAGSVFPYFRMAAVFLIILLSGGILFYLLSERSLGVKQDQQTAAPPAEQPESQKAEPAVEELYATNFIEHPVLESFIVRTVRGQSEVSLLTPVNGDTVSVPIRFAWETAQPSGEFRLTVVNNKNEVIWEGHTNRSSQSVEKRLTPGLYYWKLQLNGKLVGVRKFYLLRQ